MAENFIILKQKALQIRDEVEDSANSAHRVGGLFKEIVDVFEKHLPPTDQFGDSTEKSVTQKFFTKQVDGRVVNNIEISSAYDLNEIKTPGLYKVTFQSSVYHLLVGIGEDGSIIQYQFKNKQILCRAYAGNKWESWKYLQENFIVSEFGNSETDAISQKFFTEKVQNIADNISNSNTTVRFDRIVTNASIVIEGITQSEGGEVVYVASKKKFAYLLNDRYYENWPSVRNYMSVDNKIFPNKVYLCGNKAYIYHGGALLASDEEALGLASTAGVNAQKALDKFDEIFDLHNAMIDRLDELNNPVNTTTYYTVYYQYHPVGVLRCFGNAKSNIVTQILDANWDIDANGNLLQGFVGNQFKSLVRVYNDSSDEIDIPKKTWGKWQYYSEGGIAMGNTYDDAFKNGYKGTSEDFYKNLSNIDILHFFNKITYSEIDSVVNSGYYIVTDENTYSSDILLVSRYGEDDSVVQMFLSFQFSAAKFQRRTMTGGTWSDWEEISGGGSTGTDFFEQFIEISPVGGNIAVDFRKTPCAKVTLSGDNSIFNLTINNTKDGDTGKLLVFQTGYKQIGSAENILGTIDIPLNADTVVLLTYNVVGNLIYIHSDTVLGDAQFPTPQRIADFQTVYYDSQTCIVTWTAPYANNVYDKATEYDMRYSSGPVNANDTAVWNSLSRITGLPSPLDYGSEQRFAINGLKPNNEYYIYLKAVKVNYGVRYISEASDPAYCKTQGSLTESSGNYRLPLTASMLNPKKKDGWKDDEGVIHGISSITDEDEKNVFLDDGTPDLKIMPYETFWRTPSDKHANPWNFLIDLNEPHVLSTLYILNYQKAAFRVFLIKDIGYEPEYVATSKQMYNSWEVLDLQGKTARYINLVYDVIAFADNENVAVGEEVYPYANQNNLLGGIYKMFVYGRFINEKPNSILPPARNARTKKTMDEFFCTNGHFYQQGRLHSLCSGSHVRLYGSLGHFGPAQFTDNYQRIADYRVRTNQIPWVSQNNGTGKYFRDNLKETYAPYGLMPFIAGTGIIDYCRWQGYSSEKDKNKCLDNYWLPDKWKALPKKGVYGTELYFAETMNPENYKTLAKTCNHIMSVYGAVKVSPDSLDLYPNTESTENGIGVMDAIEFINEPDANWLGWMWYMQPEECAAQLSAVYDGHCGMLADEDGNTLKYGLKNVNPNVTLVAPGMAGLNTGYVKMMYLWAKEHRADGKFPADVLNFHSYFSNIGNQGGDTSVPVQYAITCEESLNNQVGGEFKVMADFRNRYLPDKEIWITEFGYGECGGRNTQSKYQCYTQAGRQIGNWVIPDRHRSEVKGAWTLRAVLTMIDVGFDMCNYYSTEMESSYFDAGQWGSGAGYEMFHWNDCKDMTPGAKAEAIKAYEHSYARGGFSLTGLFGPILGCGAFPISRSYWWIATFRNRLKGYICIGRKYLDMDERIMVYCFRKPNEEKGAYVIYLNDNQNTGIPNVPIPVPEGVQNVTNVTVYMPDLVSPETIPGNWAEYDQLRTQFPTCRREKYVDGEWVIQNIKPDDKNYESYAKGAAAYPENPQEGDMVVVLPTKEENPYFPIVGPVSSKYSKHGKNPSAQEYEWIDPNDPTNEDGTTKWSLKYNPALAWRQVDAVCDYIQYSEEGKHGTMGDETNLEVLRGNITVNVSEFPEFFFFDAVPDPDFKSEISDLSAVPVNSTSIKLYWNNHNPEDTGYEIFVSEFPETGYSPLKEVSLSTENSTVIAGLNPDTAYYFKMRPLCNGKTGSLSDYASATTYSFLPAVTNLRSPERSATTIKLEWDYTDEPLSDFINYSIYRASADGNFVLVGTVDDQSLHVFMDSGLAVGSAYIYKIRVMGTNGKSEYSKELETRTSLAEECSPVLLLAMTDKLGTKITLTFDLPIADFDASVKNCFALTEDDNPRLITSVMLDESDNKKVIVRINSDSISDYDKKTDIRLSYNPTGNSYIQSSYGVRLDGFTEKVVNVVGNFTDIEATFKINFSGTEEVLPSGDEWNSLTGNPETGVISLKNIKDTYGRVSGVDVESVNNPPSFMWGGPGQNTGTCELEDVEPAVYNTAWQVAYRALVTENIVARIQLSGLNAEHKYTIKAYGSWKNVNSEVPSARIKCNGNYSNIVSLTQNKTSFMILEDCVPDSSGKLFVDFLPMRESTSTAVSFNFIVVEEYKSNSEPANNDVWLRSINVVEDADSAGVVYFPDIHVHLNCVGVPTHYRIAESEDLLDMAEWVNVPEDFNAPYTISGEYGVRTLYVQVKNSYFESNIRTIAMEYKDPYVPLALNNIFINNDDANTYSKDVQVFVEKQGIPTHYRIGETADLSTSAWIEWPNPKESSVPFTLSDTGGQKSVYVQLKDNITETSVKVDTIQYVLLTYEEVTLDVNLPENTTAENLRLSFAKLKYNKRFAYGITSDDTHVSGWNIIFKYLNGMWIDDAIYFHMYDTLGNLNSRTTGGYAPRALTYTDGFGTKRRFPINVSVDFNPSGSNNPGNAGGTQYPYLLYPEIKEIIDFDGEFSLHDVKDPALSSYGGTVENIVNGINSYEETAISKLGRKTMVLTEPNGDAKYTTGAELVPDIHIITSARSGFTPVDLRDDALNYEKLKVARQFNEKPANGAATWKEEFLAAVSDGIYTEFGCHGADKNKAVAESEKNWPHLSEFLDWICDTYGENGSDAVWFATNAEVIQYKLLCKMSRLSYTVEGNVLKITLSVPKLDYFNWREFTILVDGLSGGTISESDNVKGLTYGIKNDKFMINANLDTTLETRAEKYVDRFEVYNKEDDKVAAEYFIQRLKPSLRESYLNRLTAAVQPPVLSEFHIHNAETGTNTTSITFYYTANRATHYMVSESSAFEGAEWQPVGDTANVAFVISNTVGEHTLYFKVKNQFGESGVMTYSVIYTPQPVGLTSVTVSNRADNILTIRVSYVGIPSYYRIAETSEGITSAEWTDFVEDITYTYSDVSEGKHYVYVQLKDRWDNVSEVKESFFDVVAPGLTTVIVSFAGADYTTSQEVYNGKTINVTGAATISADRADLILMDTEGNETAGYVINSNSYPNPKVSPAKNNAPTVDDSGVYPAKYISSYVSSNGKIFETPLYFIFNGLAAGNYKIRILPSCNENSSVPANKYANTFYEANGISVNLSFDTTNNKDNFVEIDNVAIGQDGLLTLKLYNTGSMWYRPGMNLVEIIKKG